MKMLKKLNRIIIVICIFLATIMVFSVNLYYAWFHTESWEQSWVAIENVEQKHTSERLTNAIKKAYELN